MLHNCPDCGHDDQPDVTIVEDASAEDNVTDAQVEIARLETERDVEIAKLANKGINEETAAIIAGLQARIDVLESSRLPDAVPDAVPVVIDAPDPEPEAEEVPPPPAEHEPSETEKPKSKKNPWMSQY